MHVGIDASSWDNERGFGRFTRSLVEALAKRDSGIRYTLLFDTPTVRRVPEGVAVQGAWQLDEDSGGQVCHVIARRLQDLTPLLGELATSSRDFH